MSKSKKASMKMSFKAMGPSGDALILLGTYILAIGILLFGNMNPFVVALLPCLAFIMTRIVYR